MVCTTFKKLTAFLTLLRTVLHQTLASFDCITSFRLCLNILFLPILLVGNLGFDPLGLTPKDPKEFDLLRTKEINNGRLAMIGIAGIVAQELITSEKVFNF